MTTTAVAARVTDGVPTLQRALLPQTFEQVLRFSEAVSKTQFVPQSFRGKPEQVLRFSEAVSKTQFVPQSFRGKPEDVLAAVTYGAELGLSPMQALQGVAIINGKPALYGDAMLAVCQSHPAWGGKEERIEGEGDARTAHCIVRRKSEPDVHASFSIAEAKRAGLWGKSGPWSQYSDRMLMFRARGFGLRDQFADALRGIISSEEASDYPAPRPERARDVTPPPKRGPIADPAEAVELFDEQGAAVYLPPGEVEMWVKGVISSLGTEEELQALVTANPGDTVIALRASEKLEEMKQLVNIVDENGTVLSTGSDPATLSQLYNRHKGHAQDKRQFMYKNRGLLHALLDSGKFKNGSLERLRQEAEAADVEPPPPVSDEAELVGGEA